LSSLYKLRVYCLLNLPLYHGIKYIILQLSESKKN